MKNKLLFRKAVTQLFFSLCLMLCCANTSWGQQVIGSYPIMDGGFEAQAVGLLPFNTTGTNYTTWTYGTNGTSSISDTGSGTTGPRSGSKYAVVTPSGTTSAQGKTPVGRQLLSPMPTTAPTGSLVVQYFTRNATANMTSIPVGIGPTGNLYVGNGKNTTSTWSKVTQVVTSSATGSTDSVTAFRTTLTGAASTAITGGFDVDDVVIYAGTEADGTLPVSVTGGGVSGTTVSWTASSDVDGGGYMVVRYSTLPQPDNDPNLNGIYAVGNTITSGATPLTGTVVYIGTAASGTSFTDAGSGGSTDYYKIYTVDKAFNYASEFVATAVVSTSPAITSSSETLTGFNYTGAGPSTSQSFVVSGANLTNNLVVSTASTDFELSADNFATAGASSISLSSPTVASTTLYVRLKAGLAGGLKTETVTIASTGANTLPTLSLSGSATNVFYYNGSGALSDALSWGANTDGSGANPSAVTASYTNFVVANGTATTAAAWTLGSNSKVIVGNGAAVTLNVADTFPITGTIDAAATGVVVWKHLLSSPTFGTLDNDSEVHFQPAATASYGLGNGTAYGKLFIDGAGKVSVLAGATISTATVKTALTVASGSTLDFPVTNTHSITINTNASATIDGTVKAGKSGGFAGTVAGGATTTTVSILFANAAPNLTLGASSTIEYYRPNGAQIVSTLPSGKNYANLTLSETGSTSISSKTIAGAITVNGTLTTNMLGFSSTITGGSNITMANGSTFVRTSKTLDVAPIFAGTVNVTYNGTGATQMLGTTVLGSPNVTLTVSNAAIAVGNTVTGTGVPAGTTVASIAGTALVLSQNATASTATSPSVVYVSLTIGTAVGQTTGVELPIAASNALNNLTFDNATGVTLGAATTATNIITNKSNTLTLDTADYLNANLQMNGASELTLNVSANQANLKQIAFSSATTAKLKLNMSAGTQVSFANSSAQIWGTGTVEITGFQEGKIKFGTSNTALTATQLGLIKDTADLTKTFKLSDQGYLYDSTTIIPGDAFVVTSDNPVYLASGVASTYVITTTASNTATSFALGATELPAGLSLNTATGAITGTPTTQGISEVPITLSNGTNTQTINFTFNIKTRTAQAITWTDNLSGTHTYGDAAIALTATTNAPLLVVSYSSSNTAVATISGSTLTIVGPGTTTITAIQAGDPDYSPATNLTKELVVNAKALSIAGAAATSKIYNQSTTAAITGTLAGGLVGADVVTLVLSGTFADANVGTDIPVTSTSTLTGADAAKYSLTQPTGLIATISKKDQTLAGIGGQSVHILGDADYYPYALVTDANIPNEDGTPGISVNIENPNYTYSSDNTSVATVVTDGNGKQKIHIVGLGTAVITASLSGTNNFNESPLVTHTLTVIPQPLASWDLYNFNVTSTSPQATSTSATQSLSGIATPTIGIGNHITGTPPSGQAQYPFGSRYRFNSSDWSYLSSTDPSSPSIDLATGKYMTVVVQANPGKRMSLSTLNATFRGAGNTTNQMLSQFAYSTDGVTFTAIGTPTSYDIVSGIKYHAAIDLSGITALQNLPEGTTVTLRYYATGKYGTGAATTNNGRQWGFSSEFSQGNTRALIIGGSVVTAAPTVSAQSLLKKASTVAALPTTGTAGATLKWYDAATGGDALVSSAALTTNTYYVSQTLDGQESSRTAVAVTVNSEIPAALSFCKGTTLASFIGTTSLKFYKDIKPTTAAYLGTTAPTATTTYYVTEMINGVASTPRVPVVATLVAAVAAPVISSVDSKLICKYIGTNNLVTFTTAASTATSYAWTVPSGAFIEGPSTGSSVQVNFYGANSAAGGIGNITVDAKNTLGCPSGKPKVLALTTTLPKAPKSVALSSTAPVTTLIDGVSVTTITAVKKAGNFVGATNTLYLIVTDPSLTADHYDFTLPEGVNNVTGATPVGNSTTLYTTPYTGTSTVLTFNLGGVTASNTALAFTATSVGGCLDPSSTKNAKTLSVVRAEAGTPKGLALTDATLADANATPPVLPIAVKKLDSYTGSLKNRYLTLTATPNTSAGSEATSYRWVLPAVATTTATPYVENDVVVANTYTSTSPSISVNLANVGSETEFTFKVFGVNGNGRSVLSKDLILKSATPKAPVAIYRGNTGTGTAFTTYSPSCGLVTLSVPAVLGVVNSFTTTTSGVVIGEVVNNTVSIDFTNAPNALKSTVLINAIATTATGSSAKLFIVKLGVCAGGRIAEEEVTVQDVFNVIAYPNPSSSKFTIDVQSSNKGTKNVQVYDMVGRLIENRQVNSNSVEVGKNYASGVYNVIVNQGTKVKTLQVIKQ